ncbi:MAG: penicillin acylase family protein [Chloroflexi bacterium]|nr:penicillin acylase family protein [Chloroflexota bacterium]NOG62065.1 penicillin acylase family protein [Chloroflexota bacterium]
MRFSRKVRVILAILAVIVLVSGALAGYATYSFYFSPIPKTDGSLRVAGLQSEVVIYRDNWAVPHIYADNTHDLFFAQGYVHAQDRWWQMEISRYLGMGRLSELVGVNETIQNADWAIRTLGWYDAAQRDLEATSPETLGILDAYSAGVNAYIHDQSPKDLATEYSLLGLDAVLGILGGDFELEAWQPVDSLLWFKMMAWEQDSSLWSEIEQAELSRKLEPNLLESYDGGYPYNLHPTVFNNAELGLTPANSPSPTKPPILPDETTFEGPMGALDMPLVGGLSPELMTILGFTTSPASSAWVIQGAHTESGYPLIANDWQQAPEIPSAWFEMGLHCIAFGPECPYNMLGFTSAGVPGVLIGHNDQIAWGMSSLGADTQDLYLLRLNPEDPSQYEFEGEWTPLEQQTVQIEIRDAEPVEYPIYQTRFGPVITDLDTALLDAKIFKSPHQAIALHWMGLQTASDPVGVVLQINRAQNWEEFRTALTGWQTTPMDFLYADTLGNIGAQVAGRLPVRRVGHTGQVPIAGWEDRYEWRGTVPFEALPNVYNPPDGMIISANNAPVPLSYYGELAQKLNADDPALFGRIEQMNTVFGQQWNVGYRAARIETILESIERHTPETFARIQGDNQNIFAQELMPYLLNVTFDSPELTDALSWLKEWDLQNQMDSPQAILFALFWTRVAQLTYADELGEDPLLDEQLMWSLSQIAKDKHHRWWDDIRTEYTVETRDDIFAAAFQSAYDTLIERLGPDRLQWRWGDLHAVTFVSRVIGQEEFLGISTILDNGPFPINRGPQPVNGGAASVNLTAFTLVETETELDMVITSLPSMRIIMDLNDFGSSRAMHSTGQSGHPASGHYDDMIPAWQAIEYHDMRWDAEIIRQSAADRLELQPSNETENE